MDEKQIKDLQEVKNIREKYVHGKKNTENKISTLRNLDARTERPGKIAAFSVGILSVVIFGFGMCCTMVWADRFFALGIVVGIAGLAGIAAAYPIYVRITKKQREKIADEVLKIADDIIESCE